MAELHSNNNDFDSESEINHEISMSKNASGIQVRTLDNFESKEDKVFKVLQKVNDKMKDLIGDAKNELNMIGENEEGTYTTEELTFDKVEKMLQKYQ